MIDQDSLFVAAGICAGALALTMLSVWLHNRADRFLVSWMAGMLLLGVGVITYALMPPDDMTANAVAFTLQTAGFIVIFVGARQFTRRETSRLQSALLLLTVPPVALPILAGFNGFGIMIYNFLAGALLAATAMQYWSARAEAPSSIIAMILLYGAAALSFFACGTILAHEAEWTLAARPDNWAEQFNAVMCIAGITGIGALSLGLNHARAARRHRIEAHTDALTGLLNRRALFDAMRARTMTPGDAVIVFDLDRFKAINDRHGHAAGDEVLRVFAEAVRQNIRRGDLAARTGGEEFVLVMREASAQLALSTAERIRAIFSAGRIDVAGRRIAATASAGLALAKHDGEGFEEVLARADTSLYRAKDGGRDRVVTELHAVA